MVSRGSPSTILSLPVRARIIAAKTKALVTLVSRVTMSENTCVGREALYISLRALEADVADHIRIENKLLYPRGLCDIGSYRGEVEDNHASSHRQREVPDGFVDPFSEIVSTLDTGVSGIEK